MAADGKLVTANEFYFENSSIVVMAEPVFSPHNLYNLASANDVMMADNKR